MGRQELLILPVLKTLNAKKKIIKKQSGKQSSSKRKLSYGSMIAERRVYFNFLLRSPERNNSFNNSGSYISSESESVTTSDSNQETLLAVIPYLFD